MRYIAPVIFCLALSAPVKAAESDAASLARADLIACRFEKAAAQYAKITEQNPSDGESWYGLVRAQIDGHHFKQACESAEEALRRAPGTAGGQCAFGLAMYRQGDIAKAEQHFIAALKINAEHAGALRGMSRIYSAVSLRRTARNFMLEAWGLSPDDPDLALHRANTLEGAAHLAALEALLLQLDPASEEARSVRTHIANDRALGDRKFRELASPYEGAQIKLVRIMNGSSRFRGVGVSVLLNQKHKLTLLLDTGASGISISPKAAEKAGLLHGGLEGSESKGIGDEQSQSSFRYLVQQLRVGEVVFNNYPISAFRGVSTSDADGLIGADVFQKFIVSIDFPRLQMSLEPRKSEYPEGPPVDASRTPSAGFYRVYRFGNHLGLTTTVNEKQSALFLIDSGASTNLIDTDLARTTTKVHRDSQIVLKGIQGKVQETSRADRISLAFAGLRQDNPDLIAFSMEKMSDGLGAGFGGVIGMPALWSLRMTIDYEQGVLRFEHKP